MAKAQPLKELTYTDGSIADDEVLSAVNWLKQELKANIDKNFIDEDYERMEKLINEAFELVTKD